MQEIVNFAARYGLNADELWSLFANGGPWRSYMMEGGLSAEAIEEGREMLGAALRGEIAPPTLTAPAAPISGTDPAPTAPVAPTKPSMDPSTALWNKVLGLAPETPAKQPERAQEAAPAPETGKATGDEGARARAILGHDAARDRPRFAQHLVVNAQVDAETAIGLLKASPIETNTAPAARPEPVAARPTEALVQCRPDQAAHPDGRAAKEQTTNALWRRAISAAEKKGGLA